MLALLFITKGSCAIPSLTLREIINGCRGERTRGGGEKGGGVEMGKNESCKELLYVRGWHDDEFKG